jgi:hypothetical protein
MLRIEVDIMSGRPNPEWIITQPDATEDVLGAVAEAPGAAAKIGAGYAGLGYREVRVSIIEDDPKRPRGVPREFALASTASEDLHRSGALAQRLIKDMTRHAKVRLVRHEFTPLNRRIRDGVLERLARFLADPPRQPLPKPPRGANPLRTTIKDDRCQRCEYEVSQFNPAFWNTPTVQPHNNCYNYGRNWRTDTFAQPGRAHGAQTGTMSCGAVTTAAMADGLRKRCTCLPLSEYPRRLMALVIDAGWDYHWYRHQRGGFWGHKPGSTVARNVDNNNVVIVNPETCARGGYTDFCDYFYVGRSVVIN